MASERMPTDKEARVLELVEADDIRSALEQANWGSCFAGGWIERDRNDVTWVLSFLGRIMIGRWRQEQGRVLAATHVPITDEASLVNLSALCCVAERSHPMRDQVVYVDVATLRCMITEIRNLREALKRWEETVHDQAEGTLHRV